MLRVLGISQSALVRLVDLALDFLFLTLDFTLQIESLTSKFVFLQFDEGLLLDCGQQFLLHFVNALSEFLVLILDCLDVVRNYNFLAIDAVLVLLVEVTFLAKLLPGGLSILSDNLSLCQFNFHSFKFSLHPSILVFNISD